MLADGGILDQITFQYLFAMLRPFTIMQLTAQAMIITLAIMQIMVACFRLMVVRAPVDHVLATLIWETFICTVFLTIVLLSSTILPDIINSFTKAGQVASGLPSLTPSTVLDQGLSLAGSIFKNMTFWGFVKSLGLVGAVGIICAILTYFAFIGIAVYLMYTQVRAFFMVGVGVLMLGLAGWGFTRPIAEHYLAKTIGIGVNLFVVYVIVGVAVTASQAWGVLIEGAGFGALNIYLVTVGAALFLVTLVWLMPGWADAMTVTGVNFALGQLAAPIHYATFSTARTYQATHAAAHGASQGIQAARQGWRTAAAASSAAGGGMGGAVTGAAAGAQAAYQYLRNSGGGNGESGSSQGHTGGATGGNSSQGSGGNSGGNSGSASGSSSGNSSQGNNQSNRQSGSQANNQGSQPSAGGSGQQGSQQNPRPGWK